MVELLATSLAFGFLGAIRGFVTGRQTTTAVVVNGILVVDAIQPLEDVHL